MSIALPEHPSRALVSRLLGLTPIARRDLLVPLALALLAAVPRLWNPLALDPFVDEVVWLHWAIDRFTWTDPSGFLLPVAADGRPPLHLWQLLLARLSDDNAFAAGRAVAALPSIAATAVFYALGRASLSRRVGILAGLIWALSPFSVFFARLASSDDALLTLWAMLAALFSVLLARRPSLPLGALCGLTVGLAVMSKTLGLLTAATPMLAVLLLTQPSRYRRLVGPLAVAGLVAALVVLPLLPWLARLEQTVAFHTDASAIAESPPTLGSGGSWVDELGRRQPLAGNLRSASGWLGHYLGWPLLALAPLGVVLVARRRRREALFLAAVWAVGVGVLLDRTTVLFSRYLLSSSFPLYLLAAAAIVAAAEAAARTATTLWPRHGLVGPAVLLAGAGLVLVPMLPLTFRMVSDPDRASLPPGDRFQYFEQWYALYGLGRVADFLRGEARGGPVTVLVPPRSSEMSMLVPYGALRLYLRGDPSVSFVELPAMRRAESLRDLRPWARGAEPTYLIANGTHVPNAGGAGDALAYTRKLEGALARDLPDARRVLHIPRRSGPSWLSVYRIDRAARGASGSGRSKLPATGCNTKDPAAGKASVSATGKKRTPRPATSTASVRSQCL